MTIHGAVRRVWNLHLQMKDQNMILTNNLSLACIGIGPMINEAIQYIKYIQFMKFK